MRRDASDRRILLPVDVGRHAEKDDGPALGQVVRQLGELGGLDERDAVLGQQVVEDACVLHADERAEHAQHTGGQAQIESDAVGVPRASARAGADDHLVAAQVVDDLLDQGEDGDAPPIDEALAADLDHIGLGQDVHGGRLAGLRHQTLVVERTD